MPGGPSSDRVKMMATVGAKSSIILTSSDRARYGYGTGTYYLCVYAFTPFSAKLSTYEKYECDTNADDLQVCRGYQKRYDSTDRQVMTMNVNAAYLNSANNTVAGYVYFRYTNSLLNQRGKIRAIVTEQGQLNDATNLTMYYRVCDEEDYAACTLSPTSARGKSSAMTNITSVVGNYLSGTIDHDPEDCPSEDACLYLISVVNNATS